MVRGSDFHSCSKVENNTVFVSRAGPPPSGFHSFTNLNSEFRFCLRKGLRTVLVSELGSELSGAFVGQLTDEFRVLCGQFNGLFLGVPKHDPTESRASGTVHVNDRLLAPGHGFNGSPD